MQPGRYSGVNPRLGLDLVGYKSTFYFLNSFFLAFLIESFYIFEYIILYALSRF